MAKVAVVHRGRVYDVTGAEVSKIAGNAWEIRIPKGDAVHGRVRRTATPEGWDDAVFEIDGVETAPAMGSAEDAEVVVVTALVL